VGSAFYVERVLHLHFSSYLFVAGLFGSIAIGALVARRTGEKADAEHLSRALRKDGNGAG
jgi:hypothetical protein